MVSLANVISKRIQKMGLSNRNPIQTDFGNFQEIKFPDLDVNLF